DVCSSDLEIDRAVTAPGASECDGDVAAGGVGPHTRQPGIQETGDLGRVRVRFRLGIQVFRNGGVAARQRAQHRVPVGIGQAAGVEDEVRVGGYAAAVGERFEQQRDGAVVAQAELGDHPAAHLVHVEVAGVEHDVGQLPHRL